MGASRRKNGAGVRGQDGEVLRALRGRSAVRWPAWRDCGCSVLGCCGHCGAAGASCQDGEVLRALRDMSAVGWPAWRICGRSVLGCRGRYGAAAASCQETARANGIRALRGRRLRVTRACRCNQPGLPGRNRPTTRGMPQTWMRILICTQVSVTLNQPVRKLPGRWGARISVVDRRPQNCVQIELLIQQSRKRGKHGAGSPACAPLCTASTSGLTLSDAPAAP